MNKNLHEVVAIVLITAMFLGVLPTIRAQSPSTPDVALTVVVPYKTVVGQGSVLNVSVTEENLGDSAEVFNVIVDLKSGTLDYFIPGQPNTVSGHNSTNATIVCDTTAMAYGNYTLSASVVPVYGETNTTNNYCKDGWVVISLVGDITGPTGWPDGTVNMRDIALVARCIGSTPGSRNWNPNADINSDGIVNMKDIALVARHFGQRV